MSKIITASLFLSLFIFFSCSNLSKEKNLQNQSNKPSDTTLFLEKKIIVDVRTPEEWNEDGHADCTVNFPLDKLTNHLDTLKQFQKIVLVCRSGNRAGQAKIILSDMGINNIENGGSWTNIKCP